MKTTPDYDAVLASLGLAEPPKEVPQGNPDALLMDIVQATTFRDTIYDKKLSENTSKILSNYRFKLRKAERFVLDDEATKLVCHLSHDHDRLPAWSFLARIPYPTFWLEFNNLTRMIEFQKMGRLRPDIDMDQTAKRLGFLFYKETESDSRWIAHQFYEYKDTAVPGFLSYVFDPEGNVQYPVRGSSTWKMPTLSMRPGFPKIPVNFTTDNANPIATTYADAEFAICGLMDVAGKRGSLEVPAVKFGETAEIPDASNILKAPDWFLSRSAAIIDPFWHFHYEKRPKLLNEVVASQVVEETGILRWLITFLASVNALPRAVRPIVTRPGMQRVGQTHKVPWLPHRNLTLEIPRDNRISWARKNLSQTALGRKLAWHAVRGHWRVIEYGKAKGRLCRHMPTMVEQGVGMCENCEMMIRWIEIPDGRGDPNLGIVDKTYRVKKRKGAAISS